MTMIPSLSPLSPSTITMKEKEQEQEMCKNKSKSKRKNNLTRREKKQLKNKKADLNVIQHFMTEEYYHHHHHQNGKNTNMNTNESTATGMIVKSNNKRRILNDKEKKELIIAVLKRKENVFSITKLCDINIDFFFKIKKLPFPPAAAASNNNNNNNTNNNSKHLQTGSQLLFSIISDENKGDSSSMKEEEEEDNNNNNDDDDDDDIMEVTLLTYASLLGRDRIVFMLLRAGANPRLCSYFCMNDDDIDDDNSTHNSNTLMRTRTRTRTRTTAVTLPLTTKLHDQWIQSFFLDSLPREYAVWIMKSIVSMRCCQQEEILLSLSSTKYADGDNDDDNDDTKTDTNTDEKKKNKLKRKQQQICSICNYQQQINHHQQQQQQQQQQRPEEEEEEKEKEKEKDDTTTTTTINNNNTINKTRSMIRWEPCHDIICEECMWNHFLFEKEITEEEEEEEEEDDDDEEEKEKKDEKEEERKVNNKREKKKKEHLYDMNCPICDIRLLPTFYDIAQKNKINQSTYKKENKNENNNNNNNNNDDDDDSKQIEYMKDYDNLIEEFYLWEKSYNHMNKKRYYDGNNNNNNTKIIQEVNEKATTTQTGVVGTVEVAEKRRLESFMKWQNLPDEMMTTNKNNDSYKKKKKKPPSFQSLTLREINMKYTISKMKSFRKDAFHKVCNNNCKNDFMYILAFLATGIDVNSTNEYGQTVLYVACMMKNFKMIDFLIDFMNVDINIKCNGGSTALYSCRINQYHDVLFLLNYWIHQKNIRILDEKDKDNMIIMRNEKEENDLFLGDNNNNNINNDNDRKNIIKVSTLIDDTSNHPGAGSYYIDNAFDDEFLKQLEILWEKLPFAISDKKEQSSNCSDRSYYCDSEKWIQKGFSKALKKLETFLLLQKKEENNEKEDSIEQNLPVEGGKRIPSIAFQHMRFLHYNIQGQFLGPHIDLSRTDDLLGIKSTHTFLLYLTDCPTSGNTSLLESVTDFESAKIIATVYPKRGRLFMFPHICPHMGDLISTDRKLLLRGELY